MIVMELLELITLLIVPTYLNRKKSDENEDMISLIDEPSTWNSRSESSCTANRNV